MRHFRVEQVRQDSPRTVGRQPADDGDHRRVLPAWRRPSRRRIDGGIGARQKRYIDPTGSARALLQPRPVRDHFQITQHLGHHSLADADRCPWHILRARDDDDSVQQRVEGNRGCPGDRPDVVGRDAVESERVWSKILRGHSWWQTDRPPRGVWIAGHAEPPDDVRPGLHCDGNRRRSRCRAVLGRCRVDAEAIGQRVVTVPRLCSWPDPMRSVHP
jgi:hypothetical protein